MPYVAALDMTDLQFGRNVWQALRSQQKFVWNAVFWLRDPDGEQWNLVIVTPLLDREGPRQAYMLLSEITRGVGSPGDQLLRITLMSPKEPLFVSLHSVFAKTASVEGVRLNNTYVGNVVVPEAYLYEVR